jgi:LPS-assembly protein
VKHSKSVEPEKQSKRSQRRLTLCMSSSQPDGSGALVGIFRGSYSRRMREVVLTPCRCCLQSLVLNAFLLIGITLSGVGHGYLAAQEVPSVAPPAGAQATGVEASSSALPDAPGQLPYATAQVVPQPDDRTTVEIESTNPQIKVGSHYTLDKDVVITYGDRVIHADHIEYDSDTGDVTATGHLLIEGGPNHEHIAASHGTLNVQTQTGRFYDAVGSVGLKPSGTSGRVVYANSNPFLFSGKVVVKRGPEEYDIYDGTVTSCQLPKPDWLLSSDKFSVDGDKARGSNSIFHLLNLPLLYLPYVTMATDPGARQSGILIPEVGNSSDKGITIGDEYYFVINRSQDLTLGLIYYSMRGWSESGTYRYRGIGQDFVTAHFSSLQDRGYTPPGGVYTYQGGTDITFKARHDLSSETRIAADAEYLSSYIYREAFTNNFNQAVTTDILSDVYGVHNQDGTSTSLIIDRYQGEKPLPQTAAQIAAGDPVVNSQITIFHIPSLNFETTEHPLGDGRLLWNLNASASGMKRTQPGFTTGGVGRFDVRPELAYPFAVGGWHVRPSVAVRDTFYGDSRLSAFAPTSGLPVESTASVNRSDVEAELEIRPPVVERTFDSPFLNKIFRGEVKHTIEPEITYRYVTGINNFQNILRFDEVDVASDTNELEYGVTQRLFLKPGRFHPCRPAELGKPAEMPDTTEDDNQPDDTPNGKPAPTTPRCGTREFFSWRVAQKTFFNENFGGAVIDGRRNILETTLNFSGIAFLTEPRSISPLISRLRIRPSDKVDVEWDFDYDTGATKFTTNNLFVDVRQNDFFAGFSLARLNAPGRFYTDGLASSTSNFNQMRVLLGDGKPTKEGLSAAASGAFDLRLGQLQYASVQASYNWNCCGINVEYRKYELGAVRNEGTETFSFTLANIGSAGNLRRAASLF